MYGTIGSGRSQVTEEDSILSVMAGNYGKPASNGNGAPSSSRDYDQDFTYNSHGSGSYSRAASRGFNNTGYYSAPYGSSGNSMGFDRSKELSLQSFAYGGQTQTQSSTTPIHSQQQQPASMSWKQSLEIESLQKEVTRLTQLLAKQSVSTVHRVEPSVEKVFRDMGELVKAKEDEISRLNATIESLMAHDGHDEAAAFRVYSKLQSLVDENKRLGKMLGSGRSVQHEIELGILRVENEDLKRKLMQNKEQDKEGEGTTTS
ncbi:hypothetical protein CJU90_6581 [Yarrowia sp. C11]|nr:hypothetical protein CJU90_6581 [Yarrowia sp. C11]KAG5358695.1 hypothetical protein CKK34_4958 [Yarrowia sp. E02]